MEALLEEYAIEQEFVKNMDAQIKKYQSRKKTSNTKIDEIKLKIQNRVGDGYDGENGSVSLRGVPPKLIVSDESLIGDEWFIEKTTRTLDKNGIKSALKKDQKIDGATLSNGGQTIVITLKD